MSKTNEWNLSKDARADEPSVDPETEKIFDMEFRRRFGELINQIRERSTQTRTSVQARFIGPRFQSRS
jgi:hypothetical protein